MSKNMVETEGLRMTSQYGAYVLRALWARMRMHTPKHPGTRTHARTHARTHTQTNIYLKRIAFSQQQWFRERASVLRYTYTACLVMYQPDTESRFMHFNHTR
jgi:hypothetical protein